MGNILYLVAVILVVVWAVILIGYSAAGSIHVLLGITLIAIIIQIIRGRKSL